MALVYARHLGVDEHKLVDKLWGDNFYNPKTRKWSKTPGDGAIRGFNKFVLEPIYKVNISQATLDDVMIWELFPHYGPFVGGSL